LKKDLSQVGTKAIAASLTYVDSSGVLTRTSAGTVLQLIPFGYSVIRSDRMQLWGQGLALNAISVMLEPDKNFVSMTPAVKLKDGVTNVVTGHDNHKNAN
jgi:hypothetical protein